MSRGSHGIHSRNSLSGKTENIRPAIKTMLERCAQTNEALEVRLAKLSSGANAKEKDKRIAFEVIYEFYSNLATKGQLCAYAGNMMTHLVDGCYQYEGLVSRLRSEQRKAMRNNRELKAATAFIIDRISELQNILSATREASGYWKFVYDLSQIEYKMTTLIDSKAIWQNSRAYDTKWNANIAGPLAMAIEPIISAITPNSIPTAMKMIAELPKPDTEYLATYATALEILAEKFFGEGFYTEAEKTVNSVLQVRKEIYGSADPIIACSISSMALIYSRKKESAKAENANADALAIMEKHSKKSGDTFNLGLQYMRSGAMLSYWGKKPAAIKLMKVGVQHLTPKNENEWCHASNILARTCNEANLPDDAITVASKVVDVFHVKRFGSGREKVPTVYEVAYGMQQFAKKKNTAKMNTKSQAVSNALTSMADKMPPSTYLPPNIEEAMRELAVAYTIRYEFKAATIIKDYIKSCKPFDSEDSRMKPRRAMGIFTSN